MHTPNSFGIFALHTCNIRFLIMQFQEGFIEDVIEYAEYLYKKHLQMERELYYYNNELWC